MAMNSQNKKPTIESLNLALSALEIAVTSDLIFSIGSKPLNFKSPDEVRYYREEDGYSVQEEAYYVKCNNYVSYILDEIDLKCAVKSLIEKHEV